MVDQKKFTVEVIPDTPSTHSLEAQVTLAQLEQMCARRTRGGACLADPTDPTTSCFPSKDCLIGPQAAYIDLRRQPQRLRQILFPNVSFQSLK